MLSSPIHIAFCVDNIYASHIRVAIKSIVENNRHERTHIHILTDKISDINRKRLYEVVQNCDYVSLQIHTVDDSVLIGLNTQLWTKYAWYRILLPEILPDTIDRVLYLDADTLVLSDLSELFAIDMTSKSIAAVIDQASFWENTFIRCEYDARKKYFCSGVLMFNLTYWREHRLSHQIIDWALQHNDTLVYPDQDALNHICQDTKILLPLHYNVVQYFFIYSAFYESPYFEQLANCINNPVIVHYSEQYKPWYKDSKRHLMHDKWIQYNRMLSSPVKYRYKVKGMLRLKRLLWDLYHMKNRRNNEAELSYIKHRLQIGEKPDLQH